MAQQNLRASRARGCGRTASATYARRRAGARLRRGRLVHAHEAQLARNERRVAQRAGRSAAAGAAVVVRRQVRHDGREGKDVAAGRDLRAQRRRVQRDRAAQRRRRQHFHLRALAIKVGPPP